MQFKTAKALRPFEVTLGDHPPDEGARRLATEVSNTYSHMPAILGAQFAAVCLVFILFREFVPWPVLAAWLASFGVLWCVRFAIKQYFLKAAKTSPEEWVQWRSYWNLTSLVAGALWGWTSWVFYPLGGSTQQTGLIVVLYTFSVVVALLLAPQPRVYLAVLGLCFTPLVARIAMPGGDQDYELAGVLLLILSFIVLLVRAYRESLEQVLELKVRAEDLLVRLRAETKVAEEARCVAELANRAKTQFFAAASHDLRQPLHAMGLFVEVLQRKTHGGELAHLANCLGSSVEALNNLFSELLDISRLDSGVVTVSPQCFEVGDLFRRLRLNFEPIAFEKGLALRWRGESQWVYADPLLLERILRNLVANALRYTNDGTVLVSARRRGPGVVVQVWDTGVGIPEQDCQHIFDEFYQVLRPDVGPREQPKGLGLGLSIVQRLSDLMGARLSFRSELGRGTVFTLALPVGQTETAAQTEPRPDALLGVTLHDRYIIVIQADSAALGGLAFLLKNWGATVFGFDNLVAVKVWLEGEPKADPPCPHLLIVDESLEGDARAIEAIEWLHQHFNRSIPAIVVAGCDSPHQNRGESADLGLHGLIKPVIPSKLRALVGFKLGLAPGPGVVAQLAGSEFQVVNQTGLSEASSPQRDQSSS